MGGSLSYRSHFNLNVKNHLGGLVDCLGCVPNESFSTIPSKIEWDLTNGPLSKLRSSYYIDTQVCSGSVQWVLLEISWIQCIFVNQLDDTKLPLRIMAENTQPPTLNHQPTTTWNQLIRIRFSHIFLQHKIQGLIIFTHFLQ